MRSMVLSAGQTAWALGRRSPTARALSVFGVLAEAGMVAILPKRSSPRSRARPEGGHETFDGRDGAADRLPQSAHTRRASLRTYGQPAQALQRAASGDTEAIVA